MKTIPELQQIEILFNSVEMELARQHIFQNVPPVFVKRPVMHIRMVVKAWWHLYQESTSARQQRNRLIWERSPAHPAEALTMPALGAGLREIRQLVDLESLLLFRPLSRGDESALCLLALLTTYYSNPRSETWKQIL